MHIPAKHKGQPEYKSAELDGRLRMLYPSRKRLRQGSIPQTEEPNQDERGGSSFGGGESRITIPPHARREIPRGEHQDRDEGLPESLDDDVRGDEHNPGVRTVASLTRLKQRTAVHQTRDDLLPNGAEELRGQKGGEETIRETLYV